LNGGASLVQIYTSMIFEGPFLASRLAQALSSRDRNWI
jgi:dihydroorotate dehydrogenase